MGVDLSSKSFCWLDYRTQMRLGSFARIFPTMPAFWVSFSPIPVHQQLKGRNSLILTPSVSRTFLVIVVIIVVPVTNRYFPIAKLNNLKKSFKSIAVAQSDPQKHTDFQHFSKSRSTVSQLSMVTFQNH